MWSWLARRGRRERELNEEVQSHLRMAAEERREQGATPEEARAAAAREFGNVALTKEVTRQMWGWMWLETLLQDVRYGLRQLRRNPGFTLVAVLTLALGIGANTAIFSVINAVLLRPLPYAQPDRLVRVFQDRLQDGIKGDGVSYVSFDEWRRSNRVFSELGGFQAHDLTLTGKGEPTALHTAVVTPELFSLLRAKPAAGRVFLPSDGVKGAEPVVILSESLWRSRFGADSAVVGSSISLDKRPFTVVGVMPAAFRFPLQGPATDIWIPLVQDPLFGGWMSRAGGHWLNVLGRLKPGVTLATAQAEMDALSANLAREFPDVNTGWTARLVPFQEELVGNVRPALLVLLGAVGLVLLIACVNIANLLLARATSRAREMAVRIALGAGRRRIIHQLLTESAVLGLLGGIAGLFLAYWGTQALISFLPTGLPAVHAIRADRWVAGFAILLSLGASFASALAPAYFAADSGFQTSLREAGRSSGGGGRQRVRSVLAAAEIALATLLLVGAGLLIRSFHALTSVDPGFDSEHLLKAEISLPQFQYSKPQQWISFSDQLMARIHAQPGLQDSAAAVPLPLADGFVNLGFDIAGGPPAPAGSTRSADYVSVTPKYFKVMRIPLLRGRTFTSADVLSAPRVTVISTALARQYFPGQDPIGKHLVFAFPPENGVSREIVGIVGDVRDAALSRDPGPMMYVPFNQAPFWGVVLVVRSRFDPAGLAATIRREVHNVDKDLPVTDIETMPEALSASVAQPRFQTLLLGLFAALALALAAVGVFGIISYSVACRTHEIGIRMAMGAERSDVMKMVVGQGLRLACIGVAIGVAGALAVTRFLATLLYGVKPRDPLTFIAVAVILTAVAMLASYVPARRATRVDPMVALRHE